MGQTRSGRDFSAFANVPSLPPTNTIKEHLVAALHLEQDRETNGEGDCEGHQLLPLVSMPPPTTSPATDLDKHKLRKKAAKKLRQQRKKMTAIPTAYKLRSTWAKKFECPRSIRVHFNAEGLPAATNAWIGTKKPVEESHPTVDDLKSRGYRYVEWDGK